MKMKNWWTGALAITVVSILSLMLGSSHDAGQVARFSMYLLFSLGIYTAIYAGIEAAAAKKNQPARVPVRIPVRSR